MPTKGWLILEEAEGWRAMPLDRQGAAGDPIEVSRAGSPAETAAALAGALRGAGAGGETLILALRSASCLAVAFERDDPGAPEDHPILLYELEEHLPLDAERMAADFLVSDGRVFAVAVESDRYRELIEALESAGFPVRSVAPAALLALQSAAGSIGLDGAHLLAWDSGDALELFRLSAGRPGAWQSVAPESDLLAVHLKRAALQDGEVSLAACALRAALRRAITELPGARLAEEHELSLPEAAARGAADVRAGGAPWVELRRDALAPSDPYRPVRTALRTATAAGVVMLLALSAVLLLGADRLEEQARRLQNRQTALFRELFPDQPPPPGVRSRLESELDRLSGLRGRAGDVPAPEPVLVPLKPLLEALAAGPRCRVLELRLGGGRLHLDGKVRSHGDADALAAALRREGFSVSPPRTRQAGARVVGFALDAERPDKTPEAE